MIIMNTFVPQGGFRAIEPAARPDIIHPNLVLEEIRKGWIDPALDHRDLSTQLLDLVKIQEFPKAVALLKLYIHQATEPQPQTPRFS
jgi:hypothetical protein